MQARDLAVLVAAGILIEDQVAPKSCGHVRGKRVVSREEAVSRIRAAADARCATWAHFQAGLAEGQGTVQLSSGEGLTSADARCAAWERFEASPCRGARCGRFRWECGGMQGSEAADSVAGVLHVQRRAVAPWCQSCTAPQQGSARQQHQLSSLEGLTSAITHTAAAWCCRISLALSQRLLLVRCCFGVRPVQGRRR